MLSDWRLSRERDAHTRCPDMGPRSASRFAGLRRSLRNGQARFERARKVVLPPFASAEKASTAQRRDGERATALLLRAARSRADVYPKPSAARVGREGPAGDQFPLL